MPKMYQKQGGYYAYQLQQTLANADRQKYE